MIKYFIVRPSDATIHWLRKASFPMHDAQGRFRRIGGIGHDATLEKTFDRWLLRTSSHGGR